MTETDNSPESQQTRPSAGGLYMGQFRGIKFYLDYSWFLIAAIVTYVLAFRVFPEFLPHRPQWIYLLMGATTAILFFISIILHELGHSIVSQKCGIPVPRITLLFIGGLAEISREPDDAKSELKIALAGPAVTVILIFLYGFFVWIFQLLNFPEAQWVFGVLMQVNIMLVLFNAIPGYPLDGGRVLRALLWARSGNLRKATYLTSRIGIAFAWFLMIYGVFLLFRFQWNAFIFLLIGIFLKNAAEIGYSHAVYKEVLAGVTVKNIMSSEPIWIQDSTPLSLAVDDYFLAKHHTAFPICDADLEFRGIIRIEYLKTIPRDKWPYTTVGDIAAEHHADEFKISVNEDAAAAMRRLLIPGQGRLAVVDDSNKLVGFVTRHDILHFIRIHTELEEAGRMENAG